MALDPYLLRLPSGRDVEVRVAGEGRERTVLLFHGTPGSCELVSLAAAAADGIGLRLVGANRPGYGRTTPSNPGFGVALEDAIATADALGVDTFAIAAISGGAPFAAALAAAHPHRVTAVAIAGGVGPWRDVDAPESWDPVDLAALELAESGRFFEAAQALEGGCQAAFGPLLASSDEDLAASLPPSEDERFRHWFVSDIRASLSSFDGIIYDNLTLGLPWCWRAEEVLQPTWLWYGAADETVPLAHAAWWQQRLPQHQLTVLPVEGHGGTVYHHWPEMLESLPTSR